MSDTYKLRIVPEPVKNKQFPCPPYYKKYRIYKPVKERDTNGEAYLEKEEEEKDGKKIKTDSADKKTADTIDKKNSKTVNDVTADSETEETSVLDDLADNFATLGIPLIIDRSADEKSELAKAEWLKVYGTVFGCSKKTDQLYNKAVKAVKSKTK